MNGIIDQMSVIAADAKSEYQAVIMLVCLSALAAIVIPAAGVLLFRIARRFLDHLTSRGRLATAFGLLSTVFLIAFGGSKHGTHVWRFEFENGLTDNGSYCTNDEIRASWTYDSAAIEYTVNAYYQNLTITNESGVCTDELHALPSCLVRDSSHLWTVSDATNLRVIVYATYVRPPAVHTNGVYKLSGVMRSMNGSDCYVAPGIQIKANLDSGQQETLTPTNKPSSSLLDDLAIETLKEL